MTMFKSICLALLVVASSAANFDVDRQLYIQGSYGDDDFYKSC